MSISTFTAAREAAVADTIARVQAAAREGASLAVLSVIRDLVVGLAAQASLFPQRLFPPPVGGGPGARRYRLHSELDDRFALFINAMNPGTETAPHAHGTWAVFAGLAGVEQHRLYASGHGRLALIREQVVEAGSGLVLMPEEIHAMRIIGDSPAWTLHLYGRALERCLIQRYDPVTGAAHAAPIKPGES